jgi:hypothetical protein
MPDKQEILACRHSKSMAWDDGNFVTHATKQAQNLAIVVLSSSPILKVRLIDCPLRACLVMLVASRVLVPKNTDILEIFII